MGLVGDFHSLAVVLWVFLSARQSVLAQWQEGHPTCKNTHGSELSLEVLFKSMWRRRAEEQPANQGSCGKQVLKRRWWWWWWFSARKHWSSFQCFLHFAWGVDKVKCMLVTAVCVSVPHCVPTLLHGPLVVHCWADLQFVHWFHCYDKCRMQNVRECLYSLYAWLHFVWVVDHQKCIVVTRVCVCVLSVCLSVRGRIPTLLHGPNVTWENGRGCPIVVQYWVDLQSVHGLRCYDNTMKCVAEPSGNPPGPPHTARMPHTHTMHAAEGSPRRR